MSASTTKMRTEETTLAYTNAFGEDIRIPYTDDDYDWCRKWRPSYSNVRIETRVVIVEVTTTDWKAIETKG